MIGSVVGCERSMARWLNPNWHAGEQIAKRTASSVTLARVMREPQSAATLPGLVDEKIKDILSRCTKDFRPPMRSTQLDLAAYDTDKIGHYYLETYDPILAPWLDKEIKLLEIGVRKGGSLQLWRDYFPRATIVGIDLRLPENLAPGERIQLFEGNQADTTFLSEVAIRTAPEGFDIIIDDASHIGELTRRAFWHLFDHHLKPGGLTQLKTGVPAIWMISLMGETPDLRHPHVSQNLVNASMPAENIKVPVPCHSYGMVGFIKELVDEQGAASISMGRKGAFRLSKFENLVITPGIVFVRKIAPTLSASPNPVPASEGRGKTTISWNSVDGKIYVSENGRDEMLFAGSPRGSQEADLDR